MSIATIICGVWSLSRIFSVILAGGVGKNGSTVAVSVNKQTTKQIQKIGKPKTTTISKRTF